MNLKHDYAAARNAFDKAADNRQGDVGFKQR